MARHRWTLRVVRRERRSVHRLRTRWAYYESCNPTVEGWLEPIVWGDGDGNWGCYCDYEIQLPGGLGPVHSDTDLLTAKVRSRSALVAAVLAVAAGFSRSALLTRSLDGRTKRVRRFRRTAREWRSVPIRSSTRDWRRAPPYLSARLLLQVSVSSPSASKGLWETHRADGPARHLDTFRAHYDRRVKHDVAGRLADDARRFGAVDRRSSVELERRSK